MNTDRLKNMFYGDPQINGMNMNDILDNKSLKAMPYEVPRGYFDELQKSLNAKSSDRHSIRYTPYMAIAAAAALLIAAGTFLLERESESDFTQEDYIVFSEDMTNTIFYETDEIYAEAVTEDDIVEYLIYTGTEIDELY